MIAAGIVVSILLWIPIGYYNLTGMELVAASLLFAWLLVYSLSRCLWNRHRTGP